MTYADVTCMHELDSDEEMLYFGVVSAASQLRARSRDALVGLYGHQLEASLPEPAFSIG